MDVNVAVPDQFPEGFDQYGFGTGIYKHSVDLKTFGYVAQVVFAPYVSSDVDERN